jgi:hypothetical protein
MKQHEMKAAARIGAGGVAEFAKQGLERALAARSSAMELTQEQAEQVDGGALSLPTLAAIIAGGRPVDILASALKPSVPVVTPGALGAATLRF